MRLAPSPSEAYQLLLELNFPFETVERSPFYRPVAEFSFLSARLEAGWVPAPNTLLVLVGEKWEPHHEQIIHLFLNHGTPLTPELFLSFLRLGYRSSFLERLAKMMTDVPNSLCYSSALSASVSELKQQRMYFALRDAGIPFPPIPECLALRASACWSIWENTSTLRTRSISSSCAPSNARSVPHPRLSEADRPQQEFGGCFDSRPAGALLPGRSGPFRDLHQTRLPSVVRPYSLLENLDFSS